MKNKPEYLYTIDDGYTALIKVWKYKDPFGIFQTFSTIHPRKHKNDKEITNLWKKKIFGN